MLVALGVAWAFAVRQMVPEWTHSEEYHYGWAVPALAAYLASLRWTDRPVAVPARGGAPLLAMMLAAWLPVLVFREANPDWRPMALALSGLACGLTAWFVRRGGGRAMARHFAWPLGFMLLAVPWPSVVEKGITSVLMPLNARVAAGLLGALGLNVTCRGNLIELPVGLLDVEEACSGIRSLQGVLMSAVFLGEMHRLRVPARLGLLASGVVLAMATNIVRTTVLGLVAAHEGMVRVEAAHDAAGLAVLGVNFALLWALAARLPAAPPARPAPSAGTGRAEWPWRPAVAVLASVAVATGLTEAWYRRHEVKPTVPWHILPPTAETDFRTLPISDRTALMLRASDGWSAAWVGEMGTHWHGMHFVWKAGTTPPGHMNVHRPEGCLSAIGLQDGTELPPLRADAGGHPLSLRVFRFLDRREPVHVFYIVQGDFELPAADGAVFDFAYGNRALAALRGFRNGGQRLLEFGIWGAADEAAARALAAAFVRTHVRPGAGAE